MMFNEADKLERYTDGPLKITIESSMAIIKFEAELYRITTQEKCLDLRMTTACEDIVFERKGK